MKILTTGDNPYTSTGYGTVWINLLYGLAKKRPEWTIKHIGWQSRDREHKKVVMDYEIGEKDIGKKVKDLTGFYQIPMGKLEYGYDEVSKNLSKYNPDIFISLADVGFQAGYADIVIDAKKSGWKGKWLCYVPIDTEAWAMTWTEVLSVPDVVIAMSQFGYERLTARKIENVVLIPHGVDTKTFFPLDTRDELKKKYKLEGKFVAGFVGRNQARKMPDRLLQTFANFAQNKTDVCLIAHTDEDSSMNGGGISYPYLLWLFNLQNKVKITKQKMDIDTRQRIQPENMNEIYNLMDVFLFITGGEGFGLPAIESQSAGVPLIMPSNTTAFELCREENRIPILLDKYGRKCVSRGGNGVYFEYPDDIEGAKMLEKFYNLWKENKLEPHRKDAREFALKYDWDNIIPLWVELIEKNGI